jgi:hypothetical protein
MTGQHTRLTSVPGRLVVEHVVALALEINEYKEATNTKLTLIRESQHSLWKIEVEGSLFRMT